MARSKLMLLAHQLESIRYIASIPIILPLFPLIGLDGPASANHWWQVPRNVGAAAVVPSGVIALIGYLWLRKSEVSAKLAYMAVGGFSAVLPALVVLLAGFDEPNTRAKATMSLAIGLISGVVCALWVRKELVYSKRLHRA